MAGKELFIRLFIPAYVQPLLFNTKQAGTGPLAPCPRLFSFSLPNCLQLSPLRFSFDISAAWPCRRGYAFEPYWYPGFP